MQIIVGDEAVQCLAQRLDVVWVGKQRVWTSRLGQRREVAADDRTTAQTGLYQRQTEAFAERGIDEGACRSVELVQLGILHLGAEFHPFVQAVCFDVPLHLLHIFPSVAYDHQRKAHRCGQHLQRTYSPKQILARVDGAHVEQEGSVGNLLFPCADAVGGVIIGCCGLVYYPYLALFYVVIPEDVALGALADGDDAVGIIGSTKSEILSKYFDFETAIANRAISLLFL